MANRTLNSLILVLLFSIQSNIFASPINTTADLTVDHQSEQTAHEESIIKPTEPPNIESRFKTNKDGLPIYGSQLFQGNFSDLSFSGFNPNYQIGVGDQIQIMIWGALEDVLELTVDAKGNVFIPRVGPVKLLGIKNEKLNSVISERIKTIYKDNIESYANLLSTQTVKVFVSGHVEKPGLYQGFASDSVLFFLDQAGGVDALRGSYQNIKLIRSGETEAVVDLYAFLKDGNLPLSQFRDGDVILVGPKGSRVTVTGLVSNPGLFEFKGKQALLSEILTLASPEPEATSISIRKANHGVTSAEVVDISEAEATILHPGDQIDIASKNIAQSLLIEYTGEHEGAPKAVLPKGATLADAIQLIKSSPRSNLAAISIYRKSIALRQQELLQQSLDNLERHVIGASSVSLEEAQLRQVESQTILAFIERARKVQPKGQILLESLEEAAQLVLEDEDIIHIPSTSRLVTVYGEVQYPNTQTYRENESIRNYIDRAGDFSDNANKKEILVIYPNGLLEKIDDTKKIIQDPGVEIIVLPKADGKSLLFAKEISTIIYQIALGARVVIGL